jgi:hypothetical protein
MRQVISLSENFISDIVVGDSFIVCLTANGDVLFVDDSLDSVQINTQPIEKYLFVELNCLGLESKLASLF